MLRSLPGPAFFADPAARDRLRRPVPRAARASSSSSSWASASRRSRIEGCRATPFFWALVALTLIYSAYVSEVYRAGIESIHPSQEAAARSLGLTELQAMRYVVLPQAIRRVVPPLLNDFIGLQKDTALVSFIGVVEVFRTAQIRQAAHFNFTPYLAVALSSSCSPSR